MRLFIHVNSLFLAHIQTFMFLFFNFLIFIKFIIIFIILPVLFVYCSDFILLNLIDNYHENCLNLYFYKQITMKLIILISFENFIF